MGGACVCFWTVDRMSALGHPNWVPTDPQRGFELMFRLYGAKKEFFDKAWVLPDVERTAPLCAKSGHMH
jgi:hypothetical protein